MLTIVLNLIFAVLVLGPGIGAWLTNNDFSLLGKTVTLTGYIWSVFVMLFVSMHLLFRFLGFGAHKLQFLMPSTPILLSSNALAIPFFTACILASATVVYAWHHEQNIQVKRVNIVSSAVPVEADGTTIAQLSDVHFSATTGVPRAQAIADIIHQEQPDIIVSTGDLLDKGIDSPETIAEILRSLPARLGKFAVTGNHEYYTGIHKALRFTTDAGFTPLQGDNISFANKITLIGVDDISASHFPSGHTDDAKAIANAPADYFTILLKHRPIISPATLAKVNLQLSGHTHKGQFFPFTLLVKRIFPYTAGLYQLDEDTTIYTSQGTGTWGPPLRFLTDSEITIFTLHHAPQKNAPA